MGVIAAIYHRRVNTAEDNTAAGNIAKEKASLTELIDRQNHRFTRLSGRGQCIVSGRVAIHCGEGNSQIDTGRVIIAGDIRIDNQAEICAQLGVKESRGCIEVLQSSYERWGIDFVSRLVGDFAFVLWDQAKKTLYCVRDHIGAKPLYYYVDEAQVVCASDAKAIAALRSTRCSINQERVADYLIGTMEAGDLESTFFTEIRRLPPATLLEITPERIVKRKYWEPMSAEIRLGSDGEYEEAYAELLQQAVACRMVAGSTVTMLSSGVDSSTVAGCANHLWPREKHQTFSAMLDDVLCGDTPYLKSLEELGIFDMSFVEPGSFGEYEEEIQTICRTIADPFDECMLQTILVFLAAKKAGAEVILDGVDGDIPNSLRRSYATSMAREQGLARGIREAYLLWDRYDLRQPSPWGAAYGYLRSFGVGDGPASLKRRLQNLRPGPTPMEKMFAARGVDSVFARHTNLAERIVQRRAKGHALAMVDDRTLVLRDHPSLPTGLERYERTAAACGIENRHPLLDRRLIEFSMAIPWQQLARDGWNKYLLRRVSTRYVPSSISWRCGSGDNAWAYTKQWFVNHRAEIDSIVARGMTKHEPIAVYLEKNDPDEDFERLWRAFCLSQFLETVEVG